MKDTALRFWILPNDGVRTLPSLEEALKSLSRSEPKAVVSVWTPASLWDQLFTALKRGEEAPADLIQIPSYWTATLARLGLLEELGSLKDADLSSYSEALRRQCVEPRSGRVYSLPWWVEWTLLYYRKDIFRRFGLKAESLGSPEGVLEACRFLGRRWRRGAWQHPMANPNPRESVGLAELAPWVWAEGGDFLSSEGTRALFQREEACRAVGRYFLMLEEGFMPLKGAAGLPPRGLFEGFCAMQLSARLPARADERLGARAFPEKGGAWFGAYHLAVPRGSPRAREAWALARLLASDGASSAYARAIGAFPAPQAAAAREASGAGAFARPLLDALPHARLLPNAHLMGSVEKAFDRGVQALVRKVLEKRYTEEDLRLEMIRAAAEADTLLSLYASN